MRWLVTRANRGDTSIDIQVESHEEFETIPLLEVIVPGIYERGEIRDIPPHGTGVAQMTVPAGEPFPEVVISEVIDSHDGIRVEGRHQTARLMYWPSALLLDLLPPGLLALV